MTRKTNGILPQIVGVIYSDVRREFFPTEAQYITEKDSLTDATTIARYLTKMGIQVVLLPGNSTLPQKLKERRPEVVLNLVGSIKGNEYLASTIPALLELLEIPYIGTGILGESLSYNKFVVKKLLEQNGVPVPRYQLFNTPHDLLDPTLRFPLIAKLNEVHGSVEISMDSIAESERQLRARLKYLISTYDQPVLVEEFIVGREIIGILLEGYNKKVYLAEKVFHAQNEKYVLATFEGQWLKHDADTFRYRKVSDALLKEYVKRAFDITKMTDYGKFDVRLDSSGRYFFLDCNSNPAFGPKEIECAMATILDLYGVSFVEILKRLLLNTLRDFEGKQLLPIIG